MFHRRRKSRFRRQNAVIGNRNHGFGVKMRLSGIEITALAPKRSYRGSKSRFRRQNAVIWSRNLGFKKCCIFQGSCRSGVSTQEFLYYLGGSKLAQKYLGCRNFNSRNVFLVPKPRFRVPKIIFWHRNRDFDSR